MTVCKFCNKEQPKNLSEWHFCEPEGSLVSLLAAACGVGKSRLGGVTGGEGPGRCMSVFVTMRTCVCPCWLWSRTSQVLWCAVRLRRWAWMKGMFVSGSRFDLLFALQNTPLHCRQHSALRSPLSHTRTEELWCYAKALTIISASNYLYKVTSTNDKFISWSIIP